MRFMTRGLLGILILSLTAGLLIVAAGAVLRAVQDRTAEEPRARAATERVFAVNVAHLAPTTATPVIEAFGEVASARTLEVRAATGGRIVELADAFRDGGQVASGDVLAVVDPAPAEAALRLARIGQAEAEAEMTEAEAALLLARDDLAAAAAQRDLREQALARQRDLSARGAGTAATVEAAELALSAAEQTLLGRRQALAQAQARISRARIALDRQRITVAEAERTLAQTVIRAPFSGRMSDTAAVLGGLVAGNERLGTLIDPDMLEVAFRVSNAEFARLIAGGQPLAEIAVTATLSLEDLPISVTGRIDRAGATVGAGQTGRQLYARLDAGGTAALRPGDFMAVAIAEPPIPDVAIIPATAAAPDGTILVLGPDDRLAEARVTILRRQGDVLIVGDVPFGAEYVRERLPQIGAGVKVRAVRTAPQAGAVPVPGGDLGGDMGGGEDGASGLAEAGTVALDAARRARLIAFVEANVRMPAETKARILAQLGASEVPRAMVERLESRMGG